MACKLVVFDMAGTTVQDGEGVVNRALRTALAGYGVTVTFDDVNEVMGLPKPDAIRRLSRGHSDISVAKVYVDFEQAMVDHYRTSPEVAAISGAKDVFGALRAAGIKVALDTGFARPIVDAIVERLGWAELLDATVASDEVVHGRPQKDLVLEAMARTGITDVQTVAKVGDTPSDIQEGQAAGCMWVIAVTEGSHTLDQLAPYLPTHMVPNITHVPALVTD
jgi:phosphonatase-like hydrolase